MAEHSKKPSNSAFKQQRLKAWQPLLTPKTVLPTFFLLGIIFIPLGVGLLVTSNRVQEYVFDYTQCTAAASLEFQQVKNENFQWKKDTDNITCTIRFNISQALEGPVFIYYRLTNYYQNHRRYVKSFSSDQLMGSAVAASALATDCNPISTVVSNQTESGILETLAIYPCGLIANSLFNDTISNLTGWGETSGNFNFSSKGIAWPGDQKRFGKTEYGSGLVGNTTILQIVPPPNWSTYNGYYTADNLPDLSQDEHFQVWMRTAGLPTFRKLYGRSDASLPVGSWELVLQDLYPVKAFGGTKAIVISTSSWMGGQNPFLGIAYLVVGSLALAFGIAFLARHIMSPRKLGDHSYIKWNPH